MKFRISAAIILSILFVSNLIAEDPASVSNPPQIPICMIGDSITWVDHADYWRKYTLDDVPTVSFVGTHSGKLGYSHAGEGGNHTTNVLARMNEIPSSPNYSLLIGTNDNNAASASTVETVAATTANNIVSIVDGLLQRSGTEKVFLSSLLPCYYSNMNPYRAQANARTNEILKNKLDNELSDNRVVFVDYETPILATEDWESKIMLHPNPEGYEILAGTFSQAIRNEFGLEGNIPAPTFAEGSGVVVNNLWNADLDTTTDPIIAGWYTVSFLIKDLAGEQGSIVICSDDGQFQETVSVVQEDEGSRLFANFFTGYEGYGYDRTKFEIEVSGCEVDEILFEKTRPGMLPSYYKSDQVYIDTVTAPAMGELVVGHVPEPMTIMLLGTGFASLIGRRIK